MPVNLYDTPRYSNSRYRLDRCDRKPGDYRFVSGWRTAVELTGHAQGVTVKPRPATGDQGLSVSPVAGGRSTVAVGAGIVFSSTRGTLALPAVVNAGKGYC